VRAFIVKKAFVLSAVILAAVLTLVAPAAAGVVNLGNIDVLNKGEIVELYISHPDSDGWGDDLLGENTLSLNEGIDVKVSWPEFDVLIVWDDGTERQFTGVQTSWGIITFANDDDFPMMHH
jgi:hypothetical protein